MTDREHIVEMNQQDTEDLRKWLESPNGALSSTGRRATFEAVAHGGIFVRTQPYRTGSPVVTERKTVFEKAKQRAINETREKTQITVRVNAETASGLRERAEVIGVSVNELVAAILDEVMEEERVA